MGDPSGLGWVGRVVAASHAAARPLTAYNLGVRRDTSLDVAARWRGEALVRIRAAEASYGVVFGVGVNDMTEEDGRVRVQPGVAVDSFGEMIDAARGLGLGVFAVGPPPAGEPAQDARVRALSAALRAAAARRGVRFADTIEALAACDAWRREAAAGDGTHPAGGGYAVLAELVVAAGWKEWIDGLS